MSKLKELVERLCPDGVEYRKLSELFEIRNGYTPSKKNPAFWDGGTHPWFVMDDIRRGGTVLHESAAHVTDAAVKKNGLFPANSVIVATSATIGVHALIKVDFLCNQRFACMTVKKKYEDTLDINYVHQAFFALDRWCLDHVDQGNFATVNSAALKSYRIPVPPIEVQREVVRILGSFQELDDVLTAEIEARGRQLGAYRDELLGSRLEKICPNGVEYKKVKQVATIRNGKDHKSLADGDIPVYGSGGVMRYVDTASYDKPSVLLPRKGSLNNVFYVDTPFWNVDTIFHTVINECLVVPKYFYYVMCCAHIENYGTEGARPSLTQSILNGIYIPVPPIDVQQDIVATLDAMQSLIDALRSERDARRRQFAYYRDKLLAFPERG